MQQNKKTWTSFKTEQKQDDKGELEYKKGKGNSQEDKYEDVKSERSCMNGNKSIGKNW